MPSRWLKALGMGARGEPLRNDWMEYENGLLERRVMFPRRPNAAPGDRIVYYAAGRNRRLIFAEREVTSNPYDERFDKLPHYQWWVDVRLDLKRDFIHQGVRLDVISGDGRELSRLMRRRSHIRPTPKEYEAAKRALGS